MADAAILGVTAIKPIEHHGWEGVKFFFYDGDKGTIMGRTPLSWGLITIFYIIYYTILALFWALMIFVFMQTLTDGRPKWDGAESLIGTSPGVGLRPTQPEKTIDSSMILYNKDTGRNKQDSVPGYDTWTSSIHRFLRYYDFTDRAKTMNCSEESGRDIYNMKQDDSCKFDVSSLGPCATGKYGYDEGKPCIYVKLNRLYGVTNEHYNGTGEALPDGMPDELRQHIRKQQDKNQVWLHCEGENPADRESLGAIKYYPASRGYKKHYFPFYNQRDYESPIVAVQFLNAKLGQLLHVECRAWAKNIMYNRRDRIGMVHFELMILDNEMSEQFQKDQDDQ